MRVERKNASLLFDIKRLHVPFVISDKCPQCEYEVQIDLASQEYLSYPKIGEPVKVYFTHLVAVGEDWREHEWHQYITLDVTLKKSDA